MNETTVVGLSGYAQSGKDTVGALLMQHGFERLAFADKIKECAIALDPKITCRDYLSAVIVEKGGWDEAKKHPEVRRVVQRLGTEMGRQVFGENFWVDALFANVNPGGKYVITDVRFPNEAVTVKKVGGMVFRVERPGYAAPNYHASEHALQGWQFDGVIRNNGTLHDLVGEVRRVVLGSLDNR